MPPRRKTYKKKTYKKRKTYIPNDPFPRTRIAKMRYVQEINLNTGVPSDLGGVVINNSHDTHRFKANGCHQPDFENSENSHQPRGWDELTTLYGEYCVLGSKITMKPANNSVGGNQIYDPKYYGIIKRRSGTPEPEINILQDIHDIMETRKGVYARLPTNGTVMPKSLVSAFSHKKTFRTSPHQELTSTVTDPHGNQLEVYECYLIPNKEADTDDPALPVLITIEYTVLFSSPKILSPS